MRLSRLGGPLAVLTIGCGLEDEPDAVGCDLRLLLMRRLLRVIGVCAAPIIEAPAGPGSFASLAWDIGLLLLCM